MQKTIRFERKNPEYVAAALKDTDQKKNISTESERLFIDFTPEMRVSHMPVPNKHKLNKPVHQAPQKP